MSVSIALLAEGTLEAGRFSTGLAPGQAFGEADEGAAHLLVRRALSEPGPFPAGAVRFVAPLRTGTGRHARGSDLLTPATIRRLLTYAPGGPRPDLAVVLVDADGVTGRQALVERAIAGLPQRAVVGLCVQEFEAWLVADTRAVSEAAGTPFATAPDPETLGPRDAKERLAAAGAGGDPHALRRTIAARLDLDLLGRRCPAFATFRERLVRAARGDP